MTKHLHMDMERVHREVLSLSAMVEHMIDKAALSLRERRLDLADEIAEDDEEVDAKEVAIEEECLKMLALHQPVAVDLRRIATVVKVNNDLERIADLAVNIGERARAMNEFPLFEIPDGVDQIVNQAALMVRRALDAFVNLDSDAAQHVCRMDDDVDELNIQLIREIQEIMRSRSDFVVPALHCFSAIRHAERIGDLATNIAEDVIYLVEGTIVRHRGPAATFRTS